jgi:glycosyltransferase involved in cell wall biosynthesis
MRSWRSLVGPQGAAGCPNGSVVGRAPFFEQMSPPTASERLRQARRLLRSEGPAGILTRLRERGASALAPDGTRRLPVDRDDLLRAAEIAAGGWRLPPPAPARPGDALTFAWVCVPPSAGAGGHTTMFRMIAALERAGHTCVVYLHDRHGWELGQHQRTIRAWWPWVDADVRDLAGGIEDAHAIIATGWGTAYPILASPARGARCYFVQDFEPAFFPAGSEALLAEATYRFGFHGITAGRWLADRLQRDYGMEAEHFDFGCDLDKYGLDRTLDGARERTGICYYCRPSTPRRAHELAVVTLDLFAARHPEVDIHLYGEPAPALPFRATDHGLMTPEQLGALYNRCVAGLSLSATNVSLVPHELLAAGCIPVVNDAEHNRVVLDSPHVMYARATPFELCNALCELVEQPPAERVARAERAAASVGGTTWDEAGERVERILRGVVESRLATALA